MFYFLFWENSFYLGEWVDAESVIKNKFQVNRFLGEDSHGYAKELQLILNMTDFKTIMRQ